MEKAKEEPQLDRLDKLKKEHQKVIEQQVEMSKNPSEYATYDYKISEADERIKLFTARRIGRKHIADHTPCQDYCLTVSVNGCTVLVDADGVGSCEHSDIGSKLACEAVVAMVKSATASADDENQLVSRLNSLQFRDRLVAFWIKAVMKQFKGDRELSQAELLKEFGEYGSTLLYAIITQNYIVAGNLGDGQILVFNDDFGVKLRVHTPKYSSRVRALVNEKCVREDFQTAVYPRSIFSNVLLTTDGIYESLDKGTHLFCYAKQLKKRFLERTPHEPYQPFCYQEAGEPFKDFSRMRTQDDCSIAVALTEAHTESDYAAVTSEIMSESEAMLVERWDPLCMTFLVRSGENYTEVAVSRKTNAEYPTRLDNAVFEKPLKEQDIENRQYNTYSLTNDLPTIELMQSTGMLRRDRKNPERSEQMILDFYLKVNNLRDELDSLGFVLNSSAAFNVFFDGKNIHVRREALTKKRNEEGVDVPDGVEKYLSHILGVLSSENDAMPVFDVGYVDRGYIMLRKSAENTEKFARVIRADRKNKLKNLSPYTWKLDNADLSAPEHGSEKCAFALVKPGENVELGAFFSFDLMNIDGEKVEKYTFAPNSAAYRRSAAAMRKNAAKAEAQPASTDSSPETVDAVPAAEKSSETVPADLSSAAEERPAVSEKVSSADDDNSVTAGVESPVTQGVSSDAKSTLGTDFLEEKT